MITLYRLVAAAACLSATPALAETTSVTVSFADLNLASTGGKTVLERRIAGAIRSVCEADGRDLMSLRAANKCAMAARAAAMPQIETAVARAANSVRVASAR